MKLMSPISQAKLSTAATTLIITYRWETMCATPKMASPPARVKAEAPWSVGSISCLGFIWYSLLVLEDAAAGEVDLAPGWLGPFLHRGQNLKRPSLLGPDGCHHFPLGLHHSVFFRFGMR